MTTREVPTKRRSTARTAETETPVSCFEPSGNYSGLVRERAKQRSEDYDEGEETDDETDDETWDAERSELDAAMLERERDLEKCELRKRSRLTRTSAPRVSAGADLRDWTLGEVVGLSRDGSVVVGNGTCHGVPVLYRANLPR